MGMYEKLKTTFKHMLVFGVSGAINRALSVLLLPFYVHYIVPREYGALGLLMIISALVPVVLRFGLGNALLRSWYDYEEPHRPILATTAWIFLAATSLPVLLIIVFFSPELSELILKTSAYKMHFCLVMVLSALEIMKTVPDTLMRLQNASFKYALAETLALVVQLSTNVVLVVVYRLGITGVIVGNIIGSAIELGLFTVFSRHLLSWGFDFRELKVMLEFGTPLIFGRLAAICFQWVDRFFINHYVNLRAVGLYTLASQIASPITLLVSTPFSMVWANMQFATMNDKDASEYYARMLTYVFFVGMCFAMPIAVLTRDVLRIFAPLKYWEAATVVPWLAFAAVLDAINPVLNVGISIKRKSMVNPFIVVTSSGINLGLNFLLIPSFGMMGAAVATVISYVVMNSMRYFITMELLPVSYEWRRLAHVLVVCAGIYAVGSFIGIDRPIYSFLIKLPLALSLPIVLWVTGFYDARERAYIRGVLMRLSLQQLKVATSKSR
ncbi:MAG: oligosaccharide flippase family protein [Acidobacteriota bacterium]|nr:oligosaccharide flippase family protein [Blastocatellia bacterium]MDW8413743.1 oligosaccharide flippase family protein [Acidobacteriota bacterium]